MNTTGWMGIGFSIDRHDMRNGDYLIVSFNPATQKWFLSDRYNKNDRNMPVNDVHQDGTLISASQIGRQQTAVIERLIDTKDPYDHPLDKANTLMWGYSEDDYMNPNTHFFEEHDEFGSCNRAVFV